MPDFGGTDTVVATQSLTQTAQEKLRQLVARIERLEEEKKSIGDDIKESYAEAKATGYPAIAAASATDGAGTSSSFDAVTSSSIAAASNASRAITP